MNLERDLQNQVITNEMVVNENSVWAVAKAFLFCRLRNRRNVEGRDFSFLAIFSSWLKYELLVFNPFNESYLLQCSWCAAALLILVLKDV